MSVISVPEPGVLLIVNLLPIRSARRSAQDYPNQAISTEPVLRLHDLIYDIGSEPVVSSKTGADVAAKRLGRIERVGRVR